MRFYVDANANTSHFIFADASTNKYSSGLYSFEKVLIFTFLLIFAVPRNYDAALHPLQAPREYVRALNAVKLERVFAKPFLGSLDGHRDGISTICKHPQQLPVMLSGACDGEVCSKLFRCEVFQFFHIFFKVSQKRNAKRKCNEVQVRNARA